MKSRLRNCLAPRVLLFSGLALGMFAFAASPATAQTEELSPVKVGDMPFVPVLGTAKSSMLGTKSREQAFSPATHECPGGTPHVQGIACGETATGMLSSADCVFSDGSYYDVYAFAGTAGQQVTINLTSTAFDTWVLLYTPSGGAPIADNDDADGTTTNSRLVFTLTVSGNWFIAANSYAPAAFGAYTLSLQCGGGGGGACTPNANTLCLNNGRFRVTSTFATPQGQSGNGMAVTETGDTGLFWFFTSGNIEQIIKVVNGCSFNQRYWVFAAGLTNVQVMTTVTDTSNGTVRTYSNPQGTAFAPVQDTAAFATCP